MQDPGGKIRHAEISIGDPRVMLADEHPEIGASLANDHRRLRRSASISMSSDVDAVVARAIAAAPR